MKKRGGPDRARVFGWAQFFAGVLLSAAGYHMFLVPNDIVAGGFTGLGQLAHHFTGAPVGWVALALNVPLFALSMKRMGLRFGLKSLLASALLSLLIDYLPLGVATRDSLLSSLFGGVIVGAGLGLILRGGATTGGTDMLGKLIAHRLPVFTVGSVTLAVDAMIIIASAFVFDTDRALLALLAAFALNRTLDMVVTGPNRVKAYYIVSRRSEEIARRILKDMNRGVTGLAGKGMYSGRDLTVLMCVMRHIEAIQLRRIVLDLDPEAFIIAADVYEAMGEGFTPIE